MAYLNGGVLKPIFLGNPEMGMILYIQPNVHIFDTDPSLIYGIHNGFFHHTYKC